MFTNHFATIGIAALALLLIGFSQTAGDARAFAARHRYRIDMNQESIAQGMANLGAGTPGDARHTSLSASSLNESAGARTPAASLITGGLVLATLLLLAPVFSDLPKAVLAAVIIDAVVFGMIDLPELRRLHRVARFDFWVGASAILGVLSVGVLAGVVVGVMLSLVWLVYVTTRPPMPVLAHEQGTHAFRDLDETPATARIPVSPSCGLTAACSSPLQRRSRNASECCSSRVWCTASFSISAASASIDSQGSAKLAELHELAQAECFTLRLARPRPQVLHVLEADGIVRLMGSDRVHSDVYRAVQAELADTV